MLVCGLHGHCAVSRCALRVFMGSVFTCALRVFVCALRVFTCAIYVHVCSPCVCSLWRQGSLSSVHWLKRLLRLQAFILRRWTQLRRGQGQTTILLWSHLFLLLFSCFLVTKVLSKIPFYFLYYL